MNYRQRQMVQVWLILARAGRTGLLLGELSAAMGKGKDAPGGLRRLVAEMAARGFIGIERDPALPRQPNRLRANLWLVDDAARATLIGQKARAA